MDSLRLIKETVDNLNLKELFALRDSLISVQAFVHTELNDQTLDIVRSRISDKLK